VSTAHEILGVVFAILITAIFVSMSITLYLSHRLTEHIESMPPNCRLISENRKTYTELGFTWKALRFGTISLILTFPKAYARKGLTDIKEANQLPSHTKKLLSRLVIVCLALFLALLLFRAFLYVADHYQTL
jgi:ABC-type transport system involved in multi-copper enzyme maturation permease subunit